MHSVMKKTLLVCALVFSVLTAMAAPIDLIPDDALLAVNVNTGKVLDNAAINNILAPIITEKTANAPFACKVNDLRGQVAVGVSNPAPKNIQITFVGEFAADFVAGIRAAVTKAVVEQGDGKAVKVDGKDAFTNGEVLLIFWSDTTVIVQVNVQGKAPFAKIVPSRKAVGDPVIFAVADISKALKLVPQDQLAGMPPQFNDITSIVAKVDLKGNMIHAVGVIQCKTAQTAEMLLLMINQLKQVPEAAQYLANVKAIQKDTAVQIVGVISIEEVMAVVNTAAAAAGK